MQKLFIIKETLAPESDSGIQMVNNFIGTKGKIISATPFGVGVSTGGAATNSPFRVAGRILVAADDGKGENINL